MISATSQPSEVAEVGAAVVPAPEVAEVVLKADAVVAAALAPEAAPQRANLASQSSKNNRWIVRRPNVRSLHRRWLPNQRLLPITAQRAHMVCFRASQVPAPMYLRCPLVLAPVFSLVSRMVALSSQVEPPLNTSPR